MSRILVDTNKEGRLIWMDGFEKEEINDYSWGGSPIIYPEQTLLVDHALIIAEHGHRLVSLELDIGGKCRL